jgi:hypothetical protein
VVAELQAALRPNVLLQFATPTRTAWGEPLPSRFLRHRVERVLARFAGGSTSIKTFPGIGHWIDDLGFDHGEAIALVCAHLTRYLTEVEKVQLTQLIRDVCLIGQQEGVAVALIPNSPLFVVRATEFKGVKAHVVSPQPLARTTVG